MVSTDVILESFRAIVLLVLVGYLWRLGKKKDFIVTTGWRFIQIGFLLILFGSFLDITDNFESLNPYVVVGDTETEAFLEKVVGYLAGFIFLTIGLIQWGPTVEQLMGEVAERKQAEDALQLAHSVLEEKVEERTKEQQNSEARFRDFANIAADWFWEMGPDLRFTDLKGRVEDVMGLKPEEIIGKNRREIYQGSHDLTSPEWQQHLQCLSDHRSFSDFEISWQRPDGGHRFLSLSGNPCFDEDGTFLGYRGVGRDITKHKRAEESLKSSEEMLNGVLTHTPMAVVIRDSEGRFTYTNPTYNKMLNMEAEEIRGKTYEGIFPAKLADQLKEYDRTVIKTGEPLFDEHMLPLPGGDVALYTVRFPIRDDAGKIKSLVGMAVDITERKQAEEALRESEERYKLAVHQAAIWDWDIKLGGVYFSPRFWESLGYTEKEFRESISDSVKQIIHPDDLEGYIAELSAHLENPNTPFMHEQRFRTKSGEYRWYLAQGQCICDADGKPFRSTGLLTDITDRKHAEIRLREAIEAISEGFVLFDKNDKLVICNTVYRKLYPTVAEDLVPGVSFEELLRLSIKRGQYDLEDETAEGWIQKRLDRHNACKGVFEQKLDNGRVVLFSERRTKDGGIAGIRTDITNIKQTQNALEHAKEAAEIANKAKSEFLACMSHELRTPLNAVLGFAQMLQFDPKNHLSTAQNVHVESILAGGNHLLELVNEVLDLARVEADQLDLSLEDVSANEIVADCVDMTSSLREQRGITIVDQFSGGNPTLLRTDRVRLKQVLINLLSNAVKFNRDGGTVTVDGHATDDDFLRISVTDTGIGIAKEDYASIFHMFHRLGADPMIAQEGTGTGIGLTVTKKLVERMAGRNGFESEEGVGSTFWFELPLISNNSVIIWNDNLSVGVDAIDRDHQVIIKLINKVAHRTIDDTDLGDILEDMIAYTHYHFRREEAIMEACGCPDLEEHISRHRGLVARVDILANAWREDHTPKTLQHLRKFLQEWWTGHILEVDTGILQYTKGNERNILRVLEVL